MSLTYELADGFLRYRVEGDVEYVEGMTVLRRGLDEVREKSAGTPTAVLFDIRASEEARRAEELRGIAAVVAEYSEEVGGRCAIVSAPGLYYGISRMFAVFAEELGLEMEVFETVEDAEAWLLRGKLD